MPTTEPPACPVSLQSFLGALQLADSTLPIGRYAHANGLEEILRRERDLSADAIGALVEAFVLNSVAPADGVVVAHAHAAQRSGSLDDLLTLDRHLFARKLTTSARTASSSCGRQFAKLALKLTDAVPVCVYCREVLVRRTPGNLAVVAGALAAALAVPVDLAVLVELRGAQASMLSAAVRLGRLTASTSQLLLRRSEPTLLAAAELALTLGLDRMGSCCFEIEIAMMRQQRADARLFAT